MTIHGRWRIGTIGNNLLVMQAYDSWNEPAIEAFMAEFLAHVHTLTSDRWAYISDARRWELTIPDANEPANDLYKQLKGLVCDINIVKTKLQRYAVDEVFESLEEDTVAHYFANSVSEALELVEKHKIEVDEAAVKAWFEKSLD